jgi:hypothetical protein
MKILGLEIPTPTHNLKHRLDQIEVVIRAAQPPADDDNDSEEDPPLIHQLRPND